MHLKKTLMNYFLINNVMNKNNKVVIWYVIKKWFKLYICREVLFAYLHTSCFSLNNFCLRTS